MIEAIKNIRRKQIEKSLTKGNHLREIKNIGEIETIGIVFSVSDELTWRYLYTIVQQLERAGKKVSMIGLQERGTELNYIITHPATIICHEADDLDFWGVPKAGVTERFLEKHYDALIDVTSGESFFARYLVLKADCDLRVSYVDDSLDESREELYDFTIHGQQPIDLPSFFENVCNYLQMVKK